jgi:hypothetical protein
VSSQWEVLRTSPHVTAYVYKSSEHVPLIFVILCLYYKFLSEFNFGLYLSSVIWHRLQIDRACSKTVLRAK